MPPEPPIDLDVGSDHHIDGHALASRRSTRTRRSSRCSSPTTATRWTTPAAAVLSENARSAEGHTATWVITVEGHCDERGTAEYNLALGDRRALAAKSYLLSLGIGADRLTTVSYGKEFPFDPGHDEDVVVAESPRAFHADVEVTA